MEDIKTDGQAEQSPPQKREGFPIVCVSLGREWDMEKPVTKEQARQTIFDQLRLELWEQNHLAPDWVPSSLQQDKLERRAQAAVDEATDGEGKAVVWAE